MDVFCLAANNHNANAETGSYKGEVRRGILAAVARVKEGDAQRALEQELLTSVELLEHAAHTAMAALLLVCSCSTGHQNCLT